MFTDLKKVVAVADWPRCANPEEVRSYLGLCTYYRRIVQDFAIVAVLLHCLTRKGACFSLDEVPGSVRWPKEARGGGVGAAKAALPVGH